MGCPPYAAVHVTGVRTPDGRETEGWFVAATLLPEQIVEFSAREGLSTRFSAIEIGAQLGAQSPALRLHRRGWRTRHHDQRAFADPRHDR